MTLFIVFFPQALVLSKPAVCFPLFPTFRQPIWTSSKTSGCVPGADVVCGNRSIQHLAGGIKPHDEVTQQEIDNAYRNANILDLIQGLPWGFDTENTLPSLVRCCRIQGITIRQSKLDPSRVNTEKKRTSCKCKSQGASASALEQALQFN